MSVYSQDVMGTHLVPSVVQIWWNFLAYLLSIHDFHISDKHCPFKARTQAAFEFLFFHILIILHVLLLAPAVHSPTLYNF